MLAARPERPAIRRTPQAEQAERGKNFGAGAAAAVTISTVSRQSAAAAAILTAKEEIAATTVLIPNSQTVSRRVFTVKARVLTALSGRPRRPRSRTTAKALSDSGRCALRLSDSPRRDESGGKVFPKSYAKFRQINRYLEIVEDVFPALPKDRALRIIDFGCARHVSDFRDLLLPQDPAEA